MKTGAAYEDFVTLTKLCSQLPQSKNAFHLLVKTERDQLPPVESVLVYKPAKPEGKGPPDLIKIREF
jgi:hypothetical protein